MKPTTQQLTEVSDRPSTRSPDDSKRPALCASVCSAANNRSCACERVSRFATASLRSLKRCRSSSLGKIRAVELRVAPRSALEPGEAAVLTLEDGHDLYMKHVTRPSIVGGASPAAAKRYRPVFDKFIEYARSLGITNWQAVTTDVAERYAGWLEDNDYEYGTEYRGLTRLKGVNKWMIDEGLIPPTCRIKMRLEKPSDTSTLHDEESRRQMQTLRFGTEQSRAATATDTKVVPESAA